MARLIIGHTTHKSATIWVRGEEKYPAAFVTVNSGNNTQEKTILLEARHGHTGALQFEGLKPETDYSCEVKFGRSEDQSRLNLVDFGHCRGQFKTFASPNAQNDFCFLLGSCNQHSLGLISNPDRAYEEINQVAHNEKSSFMIHCGDQIYYDIPVFFKGPDIVEYRAKYIDAWGDSRPTRKFLTQCPQYMIMDDHEIINDFSNDMIDPNLVATPRQYLDMSMKVYREFVHIRQPNDFGRQALYYTFQYGQAKFFVLDTRTERYYGRIEPEEKQIIGSVQMQQLQNWLQKYKDKVKFIVSSVPFVAEIKNDEDKWTAFKAQREELIQFIHEQDIKGVVFLTGDMHNSCHATLEIKSNSKSIEVHELMSSPINQVQKSNFSRYRSGKTKSLGDRISYTSRVSREEFYDGHSNAMLIRVNGRSIDYEIFRTKKSKRGALYGSLTV